MALVMWSWPGAMSVTSGPERVERRLAAERKLLLDVHLDLVQRHVAGAFDHHLAALRPGDFREFAQRLKLGELRAVVGVGDGAGPQAVAERERHIVAAHDVANLVEALIEEALAVMGEAPLRHDGAAAADDAGDALRRQRHIAQPYTGVDGEIVHALLALLDERVLVDLPVEFDRIAVHLLQRLIDRHGPDRHGRVADDPFARGVDVAARGKVHHRVRAPADRPHHLLHFLLHRGGDGGVADIRVHLGEEVAADDHRFEFGVVDVGGDDRAASRHFGAHEFGRDEFGDRRAEALAICKCFLGALQGRGTPEIFPMGDIDHFLGDDPGAGQFELGDAFVVMAALEVAGFPVILDGRVKPGRRNDKRDGEWETRGRDGRRQHCRCPRASPRGPAYCSTARAFTQGSRSRGSPSFTSIFAASSE